MFTDAKEVSDNKNASKNPVKAYMEWELVNCDGSPKHDANGVPLLKSDKDIALWGNSGQYKSRADESLILGAQKKAETDEYLEVYFKVKVKAYTPKADINQEDLFSALGIAA
jgi:hypothetical protein